MRKFAEFVRDSAWTWSGAIIVILTLSGSVQRLVTWITLGAFILNAGFFLLTGDGDE